MDIACLFARLLFLRKTAGLPVGRFIRTVLLNVTAVTVVAVILPFIIHLEMDYGWQRFVTVGFTSVVTVLLSILFVGCSNNERRFLIDKAKDFVKRLYVKAC